MARGALSHRLPSHRVLEWFMRQPPSNAVVRSTLVPALLLLQAAVWLLPVVRLLGALR
jgi:hypothetical protein